jgi:predicted transposase/invertase (TIGR01784 family)
MDAAIQRAQERLAFVANDAEALREYHMREMALSDWTSGVNHARREGRVEGMQEGWKKGQKEIARNLKAMGDPLDKIVRVTGLTEDQVREL